MFYYLVKFKLTKTEKIETSLSILFYYLVKFKLTKTVSLTFLTEMKFYYLVKFKLTKTSNSFLPKFEGIIPFFF